MVNDPTVIRTTRNGIMRAPRIDSLLTTKLEISAAVTIIKVATLWKTYNMKDCKSNKYFKGKVVGDSKSKHNNYNEDKGNYKKMYAFKNIRKEVKGTLKHKDDVYKSASYSSSDNE